MTSIGSITSLLPLHFALLWVYWARVQRIPSQLSEVGSVPPHREPTRPAGLSTVFLNRWGTVLTTRKGEVYVRHMKLHLALALALIPWGAQCRADSGPAPFRFLHITDTHVAVGKNVDPVIELLKREQDASPAPAFVVNTGDVTELGRTSEFDAYAKAITGSRLPMYAVPGNHDVRWAPLGKEAFERACGPLYRSFDHAGCHFVLLDSTVVLEHWGHFDGAQLTWLASDLRKLKRGTPVFIFLHHWFGRERTNIDNAHELLEILRSHNVVAAFIGHGHADLHWKVNGIECFMARGLYQGSYHEVEVGSGTATVKRQTRTNGEWSSRTIAEIRLARPAAPKLRVLWDDAGSPLLDRRRFRLETQPRANDRRLQAQWSVLGSSLSGTMAASARGALQAELDASSLLPGWHVLEVTVADGSGDTTTLRVPFQTDSPDAPVREVWDHLTKSTIQGSPAVADDRSPANGGNMAATVYVGSFDGNAYAMDAKTGRLKWKRATSGSIYSSPTIEGDALFIGSMDHHLYCLDRRTGRLRWRYDTGAPIFATAAVSDGIVCVGGNGAIHGVSVATGRRAWSVPTGSFFQSRAAASDGMFVLGGWDNAVYAIRTTTGTVAWKREMGRTQGGKGRLSFYYSPAIASPSISNGRVFICTNDGLLHCMRLSDGEELWAVRAPAGSDTFGYSSPLVHRGRVFLGGLGESGRGNCYAMDAEDGRLIWKAETGADNYDSSPSLTGDLIAIGSVEGRVTWLDPESGAIIARYSPRPGFSFSSPAGAAGLTYVASMNGRVTALTTPASRR